MKSMGYGRWGWRAFSILLHAGDVACTSLELADTCSVICRLWRLRRPSWFYSNRSIRRSTQGRFYGSRGRRTNRESVVSSQPSVVSDRSQRAGRLSIGLYISSIALLNFFNLLVWPVLKGRMTTRREFVALGTKSMLAGGLLASTLPAQTPDTQNQTPGAPPAFGTAPPVGPEVSAATFKEAGKLVQVEMTQKDLDEAAGNWRPSTSDGWGRVRWRSKTRWRRRRSGILRYLGSFPACRRKIASCAVRMRMRHCQ